MIVKCQTFKTTTFYKSATQRSGYLEREGRAIGGATTQNIADNDRWYAEMDKTTERYHLRGCVIGREFILSPCLDDAATPEQMREFAHPVAGRVLPRQRGGGHHPRGQQGAHGQGRGAYSPRARLRERAQTLRRARRPSSTTPASASSTTAHRT